jgi:hypothetical protein
VSLERVDALLVNLLEVLGFKAGSESLGTRLSEDRLRLRLILGLGRSGRGAGIGLGQKQKGLLRLGRGSRRGGGERGKSLALTANLHHVLVALGQLIKVRHLPGERKRLGLLRLGLDSIIRPEIVRSWPVVFSLPCRPQVFRSGLLVRRLGRCVVLGGEAGHLDQHLKFLKIRSGFLGGIRSKAKALNLLGGRRVNLLPSRLNLEGLGTVARRADDDSIRPSDESIRLEKAHHSWVVDRAVSGGKAVSSLWSSRAGSSAGLWRRSSSLVLGRPLGPPSP